MAASLHNPNAVASTEVDGVRRQITVLESFNNRNLQRESLLICSICTQIFFETQMIEQRSG
jgi:hypothetical protein